MVDKPPNEYSIPQNMQEEDPAEYGLLQAVRMRKFRGFNDLKIENMARINLVTGRNNSGKTSLLEALFLLAGAGNPHLTLNVNVARGMNLAQGNPESINPESIHETFWKPMFFAFDTSQYVQIEGSHSSYGRLTLHVTLERQNVLQLPLNNLSATNASGEPNLLLSYKTDSGLCVEGRIQVGAQSVQIDQPNVNIPFPTIILSSHASNLQEDARRLGRLRQRKQSDLILDALKIIEPKLSSIEDNSSSAISMIWGDIGLPELVPLAAMGDGMIRIAKLVLAISAAPGGLVLVDEVETGLHHSALSEVWKAVDAAAARFNTQVVATTHSLECVQAAGKALAEGGKFMLHRLEKTRSGNRCVTYHMEDIMAAIRHEFEVR